MELKLVEETVNCLIKASFVFIFGLVYCIENPKVISFLKQDDEEDENDFKINFDMPSFVNLENTTNINELISKVETNLTAIENVEKKIKNVEVFIKTGDLTKYQKALE
jgi:uncharacterized membrane protein YjjP (DUF1212 family)